MSALAAQRVLPLFGPPVAWQTDVYRKRLLYFLVVSEARYFRADFLTWLSANLHVWQAFEDEADKIWGRGREHYSARTIGEYLRHQTAVAEVGGCGFKVNDHYWPDLGRLYMLVHPDRDGFFERRPGQSAVRSR